MIHTIYIEDAITSHPRSRDILKRFPKADVIHCDSYTEVFNRKAQNFRLQKQQPALILANKHDNFVLPAPADFGIGSCHNYYISHMLNCLYDCRYCFLQGMYRSAHYVLFINYESFVGAIADTIQHHPDDICHFFSGYDCDSLALEPVTGFCSHFLPEFASRTSALLELRTKSTQIRSLLGMKPIDNCIIAYSLSPDSVARATEHRAPSVNRRIHAMQRLQKHGWQVGLRFDPLIYQTGFEEDYIKLFADVFSRLDPGLIHSVSLGSFRLPKPFFRKISALYPDERLFAAPLDESQDMVSYEETIRRHLLSFCRDEILSYLPEHKFFPCEPISTANVRF